MAATGAVARGDRSGRTAVLRWRPRSADPTGGSPASTRSHTKRGLNPARLERYIHRRLRLLVVEHPNAIHSASVSGSSAKLCSPRQRPVQSRAPRGATSDTKLLEIELRQLRQDIGVDVTRSKERLVLSEPETSEPTPDILERQPSRRRRRSGGPHGRIRSAGLAAGRRGHTPQALL